jgi:hypothetical protein
LLCRKQTETVFLITQRKGVNILLGIKLLGDF